MIGRIQDVVTASVVIGALEGGASAVEPVERVKPVSDAEGSAAGKQETQTEQDRQAQQAAQPRPTRGVNAPAAVTDIDELDAAVEAARKPEEFTEETVSNMTAKLNELMSKINCDLQFSYNKEVDMMSVKMMDKKTGEIIKEYPPEELIESMVKAKEWIGAFLDRVA